MIAEDRRRIDKWLWYARLARTRTAAQALAVSGRVRVNSEKNQSASRGLKTGDVLTVALESGVRRNPIRMYGEHVSTFSSGFHTSLSRWFEDEANFRVACFALDEFPPGETADLFVT